MTGVSTNIETSEVTLSSTSIVKLSVPSEDISQMTRVNQDLVVTLRSGEMITINNFYVGKGDDKSQLVLENSNGALWWVQDTDGGNGGEGGGNNGGDDDSTPTTTTPAAPDIPTITSITDNQELITGNVNPQESTNDNTPTLKGTGPANTTLHIDDIAFIHPGQRALVKITAYDYAIYGGLEGIVETISPDTIQDKVKPEIFYYRVFIRTHQDYLQNKLGRHFSIVPGMLATVDIKQVKKTSLTI